MLIVPAWADQILTRVKGRPSKIACLSSGRSSYGKGNGVGLESSLQQAGGLGRGVRFAGSTATAFLGSRGGLEPQAVWPSELLKSLLPMAA
jgi:hypothetical protein